VENPAGVEAFETREDDMHMVRHHTPGEELITNAIEVRKAVSHDAGCSMITQHTLSDVLIEELLAGLSERFVKHSLFRQSNTSPQTRNLFARGVAFRAKSFKYVRRKGIEKTPGDEVNGMLRMPMRKAGSLSNSNPAQIIIPHPPRIS
jgi:hypothetical protein